MSTQTNKSGRFGRGWELAKSAWRVFRLDKELTVLPLIGTIVSIVAIAGFFGLAATISNNIDPNSTSSWDIGLGNWTWPFWFAFYIVTTTIANFFASAVIQGAMTRFRGGDPTVRSSLAAVTRKFKPLLLFSIMMSTVGLLLDIVADRVPFAGRIAVWLVGAAWNIANFFALPIIIMDEKTVMPLQATRQSVGMVRKVWGESVVANVSIAAVGFLTTVLYTMLSGILVAVLAAAGLLNTASAIALLAVGILGLIILLLVFSVLSGIVKAAVYHYATSGEAPESFNRELLHAAMTPKKASKIFG
jgi:hypothetical protein